jgi:opacity protein-like surface antigen
MGKTIGSLILILAAAVSLPAAPASEKHFEFMLFGGLGLARADGQAVHEDTWSFYELTSVWERTDIRVEGKKPLLYGADAALFFDRRFGIGVSWSAWNSDLDGGSEFRFHYERTGGAGDSRQTSWTDNGQVRGWVLGANAFLRFGEGRVRSYVTAGPALFRHRLDLSACFGGGLTDTAETAHPPIDAIKIPIRIDGESASSLGFNMGAGITLRLASRLALAVEGRYFLCPETTFDWTIPGGRFDGIFYEDEIRGVDLSAQELRYVLDRRTLSLFKFHPSQLQVRVGLKINVG